MGRIELVKSELNRRIADCEAQHPPIMQAEEWNDHQNEIYCKECAYRGMLKFVDSLPAEITSPELEKEIRNYDSYLDESGLTVTLDAIARHFAEWGAEQLRDTTKMIPEGLDEAAENYAHSLGYDEEKDKAEIAGAKEDFIAGAEWQKGQMMKEAVEVVVLDDWQYGKDTDGAKPAIKVRNPDWNIRDKKNVIILKEDEK